MKIFRLTLNKNRTENPHSKLFGKSNAVIAIVIVALFAATLLAGNFTAISASTSPYYKAGTAGKSVCLMFNVYDGTEQLLQIMSILQEYGVKATFFLGGIWVEKNIEVTRQLAATDNQIGSHGYLHRNHKILSFAQNKEEIILTEKLIHTVCGVQTRLFAPPSGSYGDTTIDVCNQLGYKVIMWSKDTIDWRDQNADLIYKRATKNAAGGDFILMHPTACTVKALPQIIEYYIAESYDIMTVSEAIFASEWHNI